MQFHTTRLFLYQVAFFERNLQQSPALHLEIIREGLEAAKAFHDLYLWLPPKSEMALTNTEWVQMSFGLTFAAKFAIVSKDPTIEPQTRDLRHRLNIDHIFRHLALRIGALVGRAGEGNKHKDIFFYYEQRVRKIQKWYDRMVQATGADQSAGPASAPQTHAGTSHQRASPSQSRSPYPDPPSASSSTVPVSSQFLHQQPHGQAQSNLYSQQPVSVTQPPEHTQQQTSPQQPMATVGMAPLSTYSSSYSPVRSVAYPDLMNAQGWDNMFTIPMEHEAMVDISQGYDLGMASPPSEASWDSSSA
jgi:hypothetical protein